ncbi:MAG: hypothetical protein UY05_C0045G0002 [Candidatus Peregrinibacteria bacterium GW2011_GWA2_47_7]|nr:MAG: hypothetical protein UY05_C0045G0002 [Candidatus Peregrinibacteria bacterium GW2011_GWA2_47_7]
MYSPGKPYPVYEQIFWWSDEWDPTDYGRPFDFNRSFFEQFHALQKVVPRLAIYNYNSENSYYTAYSGENKNCFMGIDLGGCEDVYYSNWLIKSKNCIDCSYTYSSELCYQCLYCENCFNADFCQECENCTDSMFCYDCKNCRNCFGCVGLRNKEFHIFNKPVGKTEYTGFLEQYRYSLIQQEKAWRLFEEFRLTQPHRSAVMIDSENCSGDYIYHSKNAKNCFDAVRLWDCRYCYNSLDIKDGYDCYQPGLVQSELVYEVHGGNTLFNTKFILTSSRGLTDCEYCDQCFYSQDLFGCIGIKRNRFCIFNKVYPEDEYHDLKNRIIEHMKKTGEYGEFFPFFCSPFGYNESKAQEYFPITREEAGAKNIPWSDYRAPLPTDEITEPSDDIRAVDDKIIEKIIVCAVSQKPFRLIKQELDFYRQKRLPIPKKSPQVRYEERMLRRRPRKLFKRICSKCELPIQTTYSPEQREIVFCEKCYLQSVYQ